jgi:hypothetical protein
VHQQAFPVAAHVGKNRAIDAHAAHEIRVHDLLGLLGGDGFGETHEPVAGVVDGDVDAAGLSDGSADSEFDGSITRDVAFQRENGERFPSGESEKIGGIFGVLALRVAHGGEDGVAVAREGFGKEPPEAGAGTRDKNYLFGIHGGASVKPYSARVRVVSKVRWSRRKRGLNAENAEEGRRVRGEDCTAMRQGVPFFADRLVSSEHC